MKEEAKKELERIFGDRVAFHRGECLLYSSDLGVLPDLVKNRIETLPDAVAQPLNKEELTRLIDEVGLKYKIALVPRGSGTAGYGGAVPVRGGIVVDFYRMNRIIEVDEEKRRVTVEPGIVWNTLEKELRKRALALKVYPSSAPVRRLVAGSPMAGVRASARSSTTSIVVDAVEIVTPKGVKNLTGDEIRLVYGMSGTTGFIVSVTFLVRKADSDAVMSAAFDRLEDMIAAFEEIRKQHLPLWDVTFRDPNHVALSKKALREQCGKMSVHKSPETEERTLPADRFVAMFAYPERKNSDVARQLAAIVKAHGGELIRDALAQSEWDERFNIMRLKALGPSMIPSEVVVPLEKMPALKGNLSGLALHGSLVSKGSEVVLLTFALDDERRRGFPLAYARSLAIMRAAINLGGRPYAIGMLLINYAGRLFGSNSLKEIYDFKKEIDPDRIMNPGKIFPRSLDEKSPLKMLNLMMQFADKSTGAVKALDKLFGGTRRGNEGGEKGVLGKQPFGKAAVWDTFACAKCGYCRTDCTQFNAVGWESASPRGKFTFLKEYLNGKIDLDERMAELFFTCTTCGRCNLACQLKVPVNEHGILSFRPTILEEGFRPPVVYLRQAHNILEHHNPKGSPPAQRSSWATKDVRYKDTGEIGYFAGCSASYNYILRNLPINAFRILNNAGIEPAYCGPDEWCCGGPLFNIGSTEAAIEKVAHNINEINKRGIKTLVVSCPGCWAHFTHVYPPFAQKMQLDFDVRVRHITEVISDLIEEGRITLREPVHLTVTYSDPCHIGRGDGIFDPPRKILHSIPSLELKEMTHNREEATCCGRHTLRYPKLGIAINSRKVSEARETGARAIVSCCPTCESNLRIGVEETGRGLEVLDITDLVARSMGLPVLSVSKLSKLLRSVV